ncbi:MAG TPA: conjugal transfer protein TraR [bacterium]|nr:conjugal transfer protein TraR [bacterium]
MNENIRIKIKESILEHISELEKDLVSLEKAAKPVAPDNAYGRVSRMDAINNQAIVDAALRKKRITLQQYKSALARIDSSDYGRCRKCGNEIAENRLMAIPYTDVCISCA